MTMNATYALSTHTQRTRELNYCALGQGCLRTFASHSHCLHNTK